MKLRQVTSAVAALANDLGAAYHPDAVAELAQQLSEMHAEQTERVRGLARSIGANAEDKLDATGWVCVLRDVARAVAVARGKEK